MNSIVWMSRESYKKMLNQYAVDNPTLPVNLRFSHLFKILKECPAVLWECRAATMGRQVFWTRMECWETFLQIQLRLLQHLIRKSQILGSSNVSEHTPPHVMSESQTPVPDQRCQSGPSARNSFVPSEGDSSKNYGADQQRLQISDLHFDKFTTPATFACWKITFKTEVCTCTQVPAEAMLWIEEVELVDSVDDLQSSSSVRGIRMPEFEVFDGKIASPLNRIIHNTPLQDREVSLEEQKAQKRGPFSFAEDRLLA